MSSSWPCNKSISKSASASGISFCSIYSSVSCSFIFSFSGFYSFCSSSSFESDSSEDSESYCFFLIGLYYPLNFVLSPTLFMSKPSTFLAPKSINLIFLSSSSWSAYFSFIFLSLLRFPLGI